MEHIFMVPKDGSNDWNITFSGKHENLDVSILISGDVAFVKVKDIK